MACDETLAHRIRQSLARKKSIEEKKMFGGVGFLAKTISSEKVGLRM